MTIRKSGWNERKKVIVGTKACVRLKKVLKKKEGDEIWERRCLLEQKFLWKRRCFK